MKKKIESELISIAHNILKLSGRRDVDGMLKQTQRLYESLVVLKFMEEQFGEIPQTVDKSDVITKFEEMAGNVMTDNREVPESNPNEDDIVSPLMDTIKDMVDEMPEDDAYKQSLFTAAIPEFEPKVVEEATEVAEPEVAAPTEETTEPEQQKIETLDDILSGIAPEPMFVKKDEEPVFVPVPKEEKQPEPPKTEAPKPETPKEEPTPTFEVPKKEEPKPVPTPEAVKEHKQLSLNDRVFRQGIQIGLNDRIGFVKHLFGGNSDDYNRVVSQLNTADSFDEARNFIEQMVKPDYNNWEGKEDYEVRFYSIVERKFN